MIFLDLVGGSGRAKSSLVTTASEWAAGLFLDRSAGDAGDTGRYEESEPLIEGLLEIVLALSASCNAFGGRLNTGACRVLSFPLRSLDEPGVGGGLGLGMVPLNV